VSERAYPIRPKPDEDPRFTFGLTYDIAKVLEKQGYPTISGCDFVDLQQALFRFLYIGDNEAVS
jgi:hypothetical protein